VAARVAAAECARSYNQFVDTEPPQPQAQITIRRDSPDDVQLRQIIVKLDGRRAGELLYGNTLTLSVAPGKHRLRVDNTWNWKTIDLDVARGEHPNFRAVSRAGRLTWFLIAALGAGPMYVSIEKQG
jgi:hypothetical protein